MLISTRSSKEELLYVSDPKGLERSIRKERRSHRSTITLVRRSILANHSQPRHHLHRPILAHPHRLKQLFCRPTFSTKTSIDTEPRDMVANIILLRDENGDLNKIWTFSQEPTKAFRSSWERFRRYQRDCPHHGFTEIQLLKRFVKGIDI